MVCRIINPARMPKRDRWSSDDENDVDVDDEVGGKSTSGDCNNDRDGDGAGCGSLTRSPTRPSTTPPSSSHYRRLHNPLLHGSRSVYDSYTRLSHIDSGTYGIVWRAKCNFTNEIVALKQIKFDNELTKEGFPISALREINVLLALQHPNIVHVKEVVLGGGRKRRHENMEEEEDDDVYDNVTEMEQPQIYMVMECLEMDLQRAMMTPDSSSTLRVGGGGGGMVLPFAQSEVKFMMHSLLSAIEHIHSHWYLHRDIKTSNILLRRNGHLVLCDFGLARKYELPATRAMTMSVVTLWYRAPELLFGECKYGPEIDMWR